MADVDNSNIKLEIYTSYYKKIHSIDLREDDLCIQVSRTHPFWFKKPIIEEIKYVAPVDKDMTEEEYLEFLEDIKNELRAVVNYLLDMSNYEDAKTDTVRIFLLCYENTDKKPCHRTLLADYLNKNFNMNITEFRN